ncbi:hypothetical protein M406DRAFT_65840 [Cryphonectria parasitica EP155]|uniref:Uncharacterized protein n=1 Tax=Cryphonectria parasitica (strain ATCC 38755 / EP155) TaxID=660469 RepID=A0A9P4Y586_CRYP1|nr:uncharacterized protein M406DRAFT_65840 [Cryphonectria parasitica EP155]KAF3766694.1 hypothetical protein M406DRAFT_65840 [Cryphonectria parasitica EP155]
MMLHQEAPDDDSHRPVMMKSPFRLRGPLILSFGEGERERRKKPRQIQMLAHES